MISQQVYFGGLPAISHYLLFGTFYRFDQVWKRSFGEVREYRSGEIHPSKSWGSSFL